MNQPQNVGIWRTALSTLFGTGKAPLLLVFELFLLAYGVIGLFANGILSHTSTELMGTVALSFTIALILGAGVARLSAAVLSKVLPDDESAAVSRLSLFGLTGTVAYPVTCTGGRIHVYDEFGTLHDEQCYIAENGSSITKGARARIVDILTDGKLIVEETVG
jgi:membrane protein implicated in regulation of membrane protease activity